MSTDKYTLVLTKYEAKALVALNDALYHLTDDKQALRRKAIKTLKQPILKGAINEIGMALDATGLQTVCPVCGVESFS